MKRKTITISLEVWRQLLQLKAEMNARSLSEVLERIIKHWRQ
jgi:predicted CopG family antitoxin